MFAHAALFVFRVLAVVALLAVCVVIDLYRRALPQRRAADANDAGRIAEPSPPAKRRRLAYLGLLALSLVSGAVIMLARLRAA